MTTSLGEKLQKTLRHCVKHNNPAEIVEDWIRGDHIISVECGCWLESNGFSDMQEMVAFWNDRPYVDGLLERIEELERAKEGGDSVSTNG